MEKKYQRAIRREWRTAMIDYEGSDCVIRNKSDYPRDIMRVDNAMRSIAKSKGPALSSIRKGSSTSQLRVAEWLKPLQACLNVDSGAISEYYARSRLTPFFRLFEQLRKDRRLFELAPPILSPGSVNELVELLRIELSSGEFTKEVERAERRARANSVSAAELINHVFERHYRALVCRLDLGYSKEYRLALGGDVPLERCAQDLDVFIRAMRKKYSTVLCGYIRKLEYGFDKSFHIHVMAIFNGKHVRNDVGISRALGEKWKSIARGDGAYWNCNAQRASFEAAGRWAIGDAYREDVKKTAATLGSSALPGKGGLLREGRGGQVKNVPEEPAHLAACLASLRALRASRRVSYVCKQRAVANACKALPRITASRVTLFPRG